MTMTPTAPAEAVDPRPFIVAFDGDIPTGVVHRLRAAGVSHAALFPAADSAAIVGTRRAVQRVSRWKGVSVVYRERQFSLSAFQSKATLRVDAVHAGAAPLRRPYTGRGVTVAVFDTGIENAHPDLDDRVVANLNFEAAGLLDSITDGEYSRNNAETPFGVDELQHGTLVAGIVAGTGESARGADMRGMAPEASLVNFKLIGQATHEVPPDVISETSALAAYQWMLDHRNDPRFPGGIKVATNSWGWDEPGFEPVAFARILQAAVDAGVAVVFAAGNAGPAPDTVGFPARLPWIITVGATCKSQGVWTNRCPDGPGQVADFSSRGPTVDVVAPGVDIWGPFGKLGYEITVFGAVGSAGSDPPPTPGGGTADQEIVNRAQYQYGAGTSFAAPHVGGIVALMLEANPKLTHAQIERILQTTASDLGAPGVDADSGFGLVDAAAAVAAAERLDATGQPPAVPAPAPPAVRPSQPTPTCSPVSDGPVSLRRATYGVVCSADGELKATLRLSTRDARRLRLRSRRPLIIARGAGQARASSPARIALHFSPALRSRLARLKPRQARRLRPQLTVQLSSGDGRTAQLVRTIRLSP